MDEERFGEAGVSLAKLSQNLGRGALTLLANPKPIFAVVGLLGIVIIVWQGLTFLGVLPSGDFPRVSRQSWQAVFLTNNQVYFGHLANYNRRYVILREVYYLQVAQSLQPQTREAQLSLVKLGSELHGPEDRMYIPKERILFWENMKGDAQVVRAIESTRK